MQMLKDHLDLVIFAVVLLGAGAVVFLDIGTGKNPGQEALDRGLSAEEKLSGALAVDTFSQTEDARNLDEVTERVATVRRAWSSAARAEDLGGGLFYHSNSMQDVRSGRDLEIRFYPPRAIQVEPRVGAINVTWEPDTLSTVPTAAFIVYRKSGEADAVIVAELGSDQRSYLDEDVQPGALYSYEIAARSQDPKLIELNQQLSRRSRAAHARAKRDYELSLIDWNADTKTARIRVRKFSGDVWHEKEFETREGQSMGIVDTGSGVDYRTNSRVEKILSVIESKPETRQEIVFDPQGRVVFDDAGKPKRREATVVREREVITLEYRNELGQKEKLVLKR